jgi:hypothetical protein
MRLEPLSYRLIQYLGYDGGEDDNNDKDNDKRNTYIRAAVVPKESVTSITLQLAVADSANRSDWALDSSGWILGRSRVFPFRH